VSTLTESPTQTDYREDLTDEFHLEFGEPDRDWTVPAMDLLDDEKLEAFLTRYEEFMDCPDRQTAASRWSYHIKDTLLYMPLYALARWNLFVNVSLENVTFSRFPEVERAGHRWGMVLPEDVILETDANRESLREVVGQKMLEESFKPIYEKLSMVGNVSPRLLWQNLAHVLYLRYPAWIEDHENPEIKENFRKDYDWLKNLPPEQYEPADPFRQTFEEMHETEDATGTPIRPGCCLNYRIEHYCPECPVEIATN
jgi:ferric iron reductase protein FhuF